MSLSGLTLVTLCVVVSWSGMASAQLIVAHRGASHDAPENTLAAFKLAWQQQSDGIEGDFFLTADQDIVCIHDANTERTTGVELNVESATAAELRKLDAGSWRGSQWSGERIPTFVEVFATVPREKLFVIELKSKSAIVPALAAQLDALDTTERDLLLISFDAPTIRRCKELLPDIPAHWLTSFKQEDDDRGYRPTAAEIATTVLGCGADGVGMQAQREVIDAAFIAELKTHGCDEFHFWTVDSADDARYFQQLSPLGITTNVPAKIRAAMTDLNR